MIGLHLSRLHMLPTSKSRCGVCRIDFQSERTLMKHVRWGLNFISFWPWWACYITSIFFDSKHHIGLWPYACSICGRKSADRVSLDSGVIILELSYLSMCLVLMGSTNLNRKFLVDVSRDVFYFSGFELASYFCLMVSKSRVSFELPWFWYSMGSKIESEFRDFVILHLLD